MYISKRESTHGNVHSCPSNEKRIYNKKRGVCLRAKWLITRFVNYSVYMYVPAVNDKTFFHYY